MTRRRQLIILAIAVVAFAGMVTLVSVGVLSRRRNRDLMFGLEQLDVLIDGGQLAEAVAMVPWLADRADEANEMLSGRTPWTLPPARQSPHSRATNRFAQSRYSRR